MRKLSDSGLTTGISDFGDIIWKNKKGLLHRIDGPAIEGSDGNKYWYRNGKLHRLDGPAIDYNKNKNCSYKICDSWYKNGKLHRIGGKADGFNWYKNGKKYRNKDTYFNSLSEEEKQICLFSEDFFND